MKFDLICFCFLDLIEINVFHLRSLMLLLQESKFLQHTHQIYRHRMNVLITVGLTSSLCPGRQCPALTFLASPAFSRLAIRTGVLQQLDQQSLLPVKINILHQISPIKFFSRPERDGWFYYLLFLSEPTR